MQHSVEATTLYFLIFTTTTTTTTTTATATTTTTTTTTAVGTTTSTPNWGPLRRSAQVASLPSPPSEEATQLYF